MHTPALHVWTVRPACARCVCSCLGLDDADVDDTFTTDPAASPVHVVGWGFLGDTW